MMIKTQVPGGDKIVDLDASNVVSVYSVGRNAIERGLAPNPSRTVIFMDNGDKHFVMTDLNKLAQQQRDRLLTPSGQFLWTVQLYKLAEMKPEPVDLRMLETAPNANANRAVPTPSIPAAHALPDPSSSPAMTPRAAAGPAL